MKKTFTVVIIMMLTPLAFSEGHGSNRGAMQIFKQLDLKDEQREQIKAIRQGNKDRMKTLRKKAKSDRRAFKSAMESDASKSKLQKLRKQMIKSRQAVRDHQFETMLEIREILSPEQRTKFRELRSEIKGRRNHDRREK